MIFWDRVSPHSQASLKPNHRGNIHFLKTSSRSSDIKYPRPETNMWLKPTSTLFQNPNKRKCITFYLNKTSLNPTFTIQQNFYSKEELYSEFTAKLFQSFSRFRRTKGSIRKWSTTKVQNKVGLELGKIKSHLLFKITKHYAYLKDNLKIKIKT